MLLETLNPKLKPGLRCTKIRPDIKLATFLRFLATGSYQRTLGYEIVSSAARASVGRIISEYLPLFEEWICPRWITMPTEEEEREIMANIFDRTGFPGVIGCVDGTHIRIKSPGAEVSPLYFNRKGYHSLNAMVICDHKMRIRYVDARHPGSNHDAFIWEHSEINYRLQSQFEGGKRNAWILGDGGYKLMPYVMTPFRNPMGSHERRYNTKHTSARNVVERCFGILKNRFRCIICSRGLHYSPEQATKIINACCALHNICIKYNICEDTDDRTVENESFISGNEDETSEDEIVASEIRRNIALNL